MEDSQPEMMKQDPERNYEKLETILKIGIALLLLAIVIGAGAFIYRYITSRDAPAKNYFDYQLRIWQTAVENAPKNATVHTNLGYVYLKMKDHRKAISEFQTAIKLDPKTTAAYYNLGVAYYETGETDLAVKNLKTAAEQAPERNKALAYFKLAEIYKEKKMYDQAIDAVQKSIQDNATLWNTYFLLGQLYEAKGNKDLALEQYKKAELFNANDPNIQEALKRLGEKR